MRANALSYAGYAYDAHSGLCCLSKRCDDPATAQFLAQDPANAHRTNCPCTVAQRLRPAGCTPLAVRAHIAWRAGPAPESAVFSRLRKAKPLDELSWRNHLNA